MRIGLFDSGVGGLTVLNTIVSKYPNNEYIYYGDTINAPYGSKSVVELERLSSNIIEFLISKKVDLIIIACGTVSSNLAPLLRKKYDIKIVDIISPVIDYINNNNYKKIGVLATPATINSKVFEYALNKDVKGIACTEFVPLIESNNFELLDKYIPLYLKDLKDRDLIVLGCTHYPIIKDKINNYFNNSIRLLDMSECLFDNFDNNSKKSIELYFSKLDDNIVSNIKNILGFDDYSIEKKLVF